MGVLFFLLFFSLSLTFEWSHEGHEEHKEEIFFFFVLFVSFVVPSLTSRSGEGESFLERRGPWIKYQCSLSVTPYETMSTLPVGESVTSHGQQQAEQHHQHTCESGNQYIMFNFSSARCSSSRQGSLFSFNTLDGSKQFD